jgi:hypothetical protein
LTKYTPIPAVSRLGDMVLGNHADTIERKTAVPWFFPRFMDFEVRGGKGWIRFYFGLLRGRRRWIWGLMVTIMGWYIYKKVS